jgi:hypothetical protein
MLYIAYEARDDVDTSAGFSQVMRRIFTTREALNTFMFSQKWVPDRCYKPERMVLPYTAVSICFAEDGAILTEQQIDYSAHAPPTPADEGRVKACSKYLTEKMLSAISPAAPSGGRKGND